MWPWKTKSLPHLEIKDLAGKVIFTARWSSLEGRDLSGLTLHNANLVGIKMDYAICRGADFTGSKFNRSSLRGCDLRQAALNYCDFTRASLVKAKIAGADLSCSEFGSKKNRCDMTDVVGTREALFDSRELIHGGKFNDGKGKKFKPTKLQPMSRSAQARLPERPRCLLVLGEVGFQGHRYEGSDRNVQRPRASRRSHFAKRVAVCERG
jgi:hypothetical protein